MCNEELLELTGGGGTQGNHTPLPPQLSTYSVHWGLILMEIKVNAAFLMLSFIPYAKKCNKNKTAYSEHDTFKAYIFNRIFRMKRVIVVC